MLYIDFSLDYTSNIEKNIEEILLAENKRQKTKEAYNESL